MSQAPTPNPGSPARPRKRLKRWLIALAVVVVLIPVLWVAATRSAFTRSLITSQLENIFDAHVDAGAIVVEPSGWIVVRDAVVRAKGIQGAGARVFEIERLEVLPVWRSLAGSSPRLREIRMEHPVLRFSQCVEDGSVNVARISLPSGGAAPLGEPPTVEVRGGVLELGEHHQDGRYLTLRRMDVSGEIRPDPAKPGEWIVALREHARDPSTGVRVDGRVAEQELRLAISGVSLNAFPLESIPTPLRDTFRQLDVKGTIGTTTFTYTRAGEVEAAVELVDVGINLPVEVQPEEDDEGRLLPLPKELGGRLMRVEKVNGLVRVAGGELTGEFTGMVEELPYRVRLSYGGTTAIAPFTLELSASGFELTKKPQIMRFAPGVAQRRMSQFSDPTGIVDATVVVRRPAPVDGKASDLLVSGDIILRDGTASFERFPYTFEKMSGHWRFDEGQIEIVRIEGTAPSGAHIVGYGHIAPPTGGAAVDLDLEITSLPVDDALASALGPRKKILDALFSRERYRELLEAGLVLSPQRRREIDARLDALARGDAPAFEGERAFLEAERVTPAFAPEAVVRVGVRINRTFGPDGEWTDTIAIEMPEARILPEVVPYPLIARNVTILKQNDGARVFGGSFEGLRGGKASVRASVDLRKVDDPTIPFVPEVALEASDVPVDPLLLHAIPARVGPGGISPRDVLRDLGVGGFLHGVKVKVGMTGANEPAFAVDLAVQDGSALPRACWGEVGAPARVFVSDLEGTVHVDERVVRADLKGVASSAAEMEGAKAPVSLRADVAYAGEGRTLRIDAEGTGVDVALPLEDLIGPFAKETAEMLGGRRREADPRGILTGTLAVRREGEGEVSGSVSLAAPSGAFTLDGRRLELGGTTGTVEFEWGAARGLTFGKFASEARMNGEEVGRLSLDGRVTLDAAHRSRGERLAVGVAGGRLESALVDAAIDLAQSESLRAWRTKLNPRGAFDATLAIRGRGEEKDGFDVSGTFQPSSLTIRYDDADVAFSRVGGSVEVTPEGGRLDAVRLDAGDWTMDFTGSWLRHDDGRTTLQGEYRGASEGVPASLAHVLPGALTSLMKDLKLELAGPTSVERGRVSLVIPADESRPVGVKVSGLLSASSASADVGVEVREASGVADFSYARLDPSRDPEFDLKVSLARARAMDVQVREGRVRVTSGSAGDVLIPVIAGECHGGRLAGSAAVRAPATEGSPRAYECEMRLADVRFAPLLADLEGAGTSTMPGSGSAGMLEPRVPSVDESRGRLDAQFSMAGVSGSPASRRGRGAGSIGGERVANIPLLVPLVKMSSFQLPVDERLDYASGSFLLQGETAMFDDLTLSSASVSVQGTGTVDLPTRGLDLRFRARNKVGIPVLSRILEGIRNELVSAEVRGTLRDPKIRIVPFRGTSRWVEKALGTRSTDEDRLDALERGRSGARSRAETRVFTQEK